MRYFRVTLRSCQGATELIDLNCADDLDVSRRLDVAIDDITRWRPNKAPWRVMDVVEVRRIAGGPPLAMLSGAV